MRTDSVQCPPLPGGWESTRSLVLFLYYHILTDEFWGEVNTIPSKVMPTTSLHTGTQTSVN